MANPLANACMSHVLNRQQIDSNTRKLMDALKSITFSGKVTAKYLDG